MSEKYILDREVLIFAFRYSLGRVSVAPISVINSIKDNIGGISNSDIEMFIREIEEFLESIKNLDFYEDFDVEHWVDLKKYLKNELKYRI